MPCLQRTNYHGFLIVKVNKLQYCFLFNTTKYMSLWKKLLTYFFEYCIINIRDTYSYKNDFEFVFNLENVR